MPPTRKNQFKLLLSDEELASLKALSEEEGVSAADFVRSLLRARQRGESGGVFESLEKRFDNLASLAELVGKKQTAARLRSKAKKLQAINPRTKKK